MGSVDKGVARLDRRGRLKEARHGTRHFTTWRPAELERALVRRGKARAARGRRACSR